MGRPPDDTTEVTVPLSLQISRPARADESTLRRAYEHGLWARREFRAWSFADVEAELRAGWVLSGETVRWQDVREAVREGFEQPPGTD